MPGRGAPDAEEGGGFDRQLLGLLRQRRHPGQHGQLGGHRLLRRQGRGTRDDGGDGARPRPGDPRQRDLAGTDRSQLGSRLGHPQGAHGRGHRHDAAQAPGRSDGDRRNRRLSGLGRRRLHDRSEPAGRCRLDPDGVNPGDPR